MPPKEGAPGSGFRSGGFAPAGLGVSGGLSIVGAALPTGSWLLGGRGSELGILGGWGVPRGLSIVRDGIGELGGQCPGGFASWGHQDDSPGLGIAGGCSPLNPGDAGLLSGGAAVGGWAKGGLRRLQRAGKGVGPPHTHPRAGGVPVRAPACARSHPRAGGCGGAGAGPGASGETRARGCCCPRRGGMCAPTPGTLTPPLPADTLKTPPNPRHPPKAPR